MAQAKYEIALNGYEKSLGFNNPAILMVAFNCAILLSNIGSIDEAETMYERVAQARDAVLGPHHPTTLGCIHNLGALLSKKRDLEGPRGCKGNVRQGTGRVQCVSVSVSGPPPHHPLTITSRENLDKILSNL